MLKRIDLSGVQIVGSFLYFTVLDNWRYKHTCVDELFFFCFFVVFMKSVSQNDHMLIAAW